MESQRSQNSQHSFEKEVRGLTVPDFKAYSKATVFIQFGTGRESRDRFTHTGSSWFSHIC